MTIEFEQYQKLISQLAWKGLKKLGSFGIYSMEYEDVYQEMCVNYQLALKTYDASKGAFTTYLSTVCVRQFHRVYLELAEEKQHTLSVDDVSSNEEDEFSLYDVIASSEPLVEDKVLHNLESMAKLERLSSEAKGVVMELIDPSTELRQYHDALTAQTMFGRENNIKHGRVASDIGISTIYEYYEVPRDKRRSIRDELGKAFGVDL